MSDHSEHILERPREQQAIRHKCFPPTGTFVEFEKEEIEQSIPGWFDKIPCKFRDRIAVKSFTQEVGCVELNRSLKNGGFLMAAMPGVLKAGNFVKFLDPCFPKAGLAWILEDSRAKGRVAVRHNASLARDGAGSHCRIVEFGSRMKTR